MNFDSVHGRWQEKAQVQDDAIQYPEPDILENAG